MTEINVAETRKKIYYLQDKIIALGDKLKMYVKLKKVLEDILEEENAKTLHP